MGATNHTSFYDLSQFVGTDKPAWLQDYNGDMLKIDTGINAAKIAADSAALDASTAQSGADTANNAITNTITPAITALQTTVGNQGGTLNTITSLIGNGTPTTTDQTIIGAINELHTDQGVLSDLETTAKTSLVDAINELHSGVLLASVDSDGILTLSAILDLLYSEAYPKINALDDIQKSRVKYIGSRTGSWSCYDLKDITSNDELVFSNSSKNAISYTTLKTNASEIGYVTLSDMVDHDSSSIVSSVGATYSIIVL